MHLKPIKRGLQLCAGQPAGCEAAIHAMRKIFDSADSEGFLQVDATNAFNCLNRGAALRNISVLCPSLSTILINTYRVSSKLYIDGSHMLSQEGTTQGHPLAMPMYALGVVPLIQKLTDVDVSQIWYADDAAAGGSLQSLRSWWIHLTTLGPDYGYFSNAVKTCLIVKPQHLRKARALFHGTGVVITAAGKRYLGSALGTNDFLMSYVQGKVSTWVGETFWNCCHPAHAAFTHVFQHCWSYIARTVPSVSELFVLLDNVLSFCFLPAMTGLPAFGPIERELLLLPAHLGGLGVIIPTVYFSSSFFVLCSCYCSFS